MKGCNLAGFVQIRNQFLQVFNLGHQPGQPAKGFVGFDILIHFYGRIPHHNPTGWHVLQDRAGAARNHTIAQFDMISDPGLSAQNHAVPQNG